MKVILAPRAALHVAITVPTWKTMKALTNGGFGELPGDAVTADLAENETLRRDVSAAMPRTRAVDNMVRGGHPADFAAVWCDALISGGQTDATALDLIRQHAHPEGGEQHAIEHDGVPADRRLRNAWMNVGDRVVIDMALARTIFAERLIEAKTMAVIALRKTVDVASFLACGAPHEAAYEGLAAIDLRKLGGNVMKAATPEQLLGLWPADLSWHRPVAA